MSRERVRRRVQRVRAHDHVIGGEVIRPVEHEFVGLIVSRIDGRFDQVGARQVGGQQDTDEAGACIGARVGRGAWAWRGA